ncbi:uncharacterized protein LOC121373489 [Gigantopelta aegis]|uniref:uncharacterized protein LOC121373489 n=1 Tax=Gigantopelta aegis TaxID=1735272 RepID=UPI001B88AADD|nr:uncharacterized protein LOC121373489 [Gigantopelta aegis]
MTLHKILVTFCLWLAVVHIHGATLKVSESCKDAPDSCPVNSICQAVGCLDKLCVCQNKTLASADNTECLRVVDFGEPCTGTGLTCTKRAECSADNICVCQFGFIKSDGGKRCRKLSTGGGERSALLGESCDDKSVYCENSRNKQCINGTCTCKTGKRAVSEMEFYSLPLFTECVPENFSLGITVNPEDCLGVVTLGEICYSDKNCPENSECIRVGCDMKCTCKDGTITSDNFQSCLAVRELGQQCNTTSVCATKYSYCKPQVRGECTCHPSHFAGADDKFCKRRPYPCAACVKEWATLGEACERQGVECDDDLVCGTNNKCQCKEGYRVATLLERKTFFLRGYCIRNEIKIEYSDEELETNCVTTTATATTTISTTSTTTKTETTATKEAETSTNTTEPTTTTTETSTTNAETTTTTAEPTTISAEATTTSAEIIKTTAEPTTTTAEPITTSAELTTTSAELTTTTAEPTTTTAEPTTTSVKPTTTTTTTTTAELTTPMESALCKTKDSVYCLLAEFIPSYKLFINAKNCPHISGDCPVGCHYKQPEICEIYDKSNYRSLKRVSIWIVSPWLIPPPSPVVYKLKQTF